MLSVFKHHHFGLVVVDAAHPSIEVNGNKKHVLWTNSAPHGWFYLSAETAVFDGPQDENEEGQIVPFDIAPPLFTPVEGPFADAVIARYVRWKRARAFSRYAVRRMVDWAVMRLES